MNLNASRLKRATEFYRALWANNGTHSEEYIIVRIASLIRDTEFDAWVIASLAIIPSFVAGVVAGILVVLGVLYLT